MRENDGSVRFLYSTFIGRLFLKLIMKTHADRLIVKYLRSPLSRPLISMYAKRHDIPLTKTELESFRTYRDFFVRKRGHAAIDTSPDHLISPCDGWLSAYPVNENSSFAIKGSRYRVSDLLQDDTLAKNYDGGLCLVFRLCASDYHHYCYIDNGYQGKNHYIPGVLHSVQPIACANYPVYTLNRRSWCLMTTENFGPVVQTEIGALIVGGISNNRENIRVIRGNEKGHFELAGSTIVLLFEPGRVRLLQRYETCLTEGREMRVYQGAWIAVGSHTENQYD